MAIEPSTAFSAATERLNRLTKIYVDDIEAIIANNNWISTLVMAEIAGLAGYRKLSGETGLSLRFTLVVIVLSGSLALLIWSTIRARRGHKELNLHVHDFVRECSEFIGNTGISVDIQLEQLSQKERNVYSTMVDPSIKARLNETFGLALFGIATVFAGVFILFGEIVNAWVNLLTSLFSSVAP